MQHHKPADLSQRQWHSAKKIIAFVHTLTGGARSVSISQIANGSQLSLKTTNRLLPILVRDRIIGRRITHIGRPALTWVYSPDKQRSAPKQRHRTDRVASAEPEIRQALREDRESLRAVARRFDVCADTVHEIRREIAPYDAGTAATWRCSTCGALITSPRCLLCSL